MENTLENKAKFSALYYGQRVAKPINHKKLSPTIVDAHILLNPERYFLQLKPLSAISKAEALEIAKYVGLVNAKAHSLDGKMIVVRDDSYAIIFDKGVITMYYNNKIWHDDTLRIADKVRSMGFLYEFMDLSREEILNRGWAVLEQPENN